MNGMRRDEYREERRPARFVCPRCGVGDHYYTAEGQACAYCTSGRVVDRVSTALRAVWPGRKRGGGAA